MKKRRRIIIPVVGCAAISAPIGEPRVIGELVLEWLVENLELAR